MSMTDLAPAPTPVSPAQPSRWRPSRLAIVIVVVLVVLIAFVVVGNQIKLHYYAVSPGSAQAVDPLVSVPADRGHPVHGSILLTDVYLTQMTLLNAIPLLLESNTQIISANELLGPYTPPDQLVAQGYLEMAQSQSAAKAAAFTRLGYTVPEQDSGALVYAVASGSPASSGLKAAQIVTAVNGTPTPTSCAFVAAVHELPAGTRVQLSVEQSTVNGQGSLVPGPVNQVPVTLGAVPKGTPTTSACPGVSGPEKGFLGVSVETQQDFTYPFNVSVDTSQIGGPSAGLAMTLAIMDKLSTGDLTGGRKVAATGTIDADGNVGDVGGVAQKTVAVENAGATVFFVPPGEYKDAKSKANASLHVYAVSTLSQALSKLAALGGTPASPQPPTASASAPSPGG
jgi:Lon-like protease